MAQARKAAAEAARQQQEVSVYPLSSSLLALAHGERGP